MVLASKKIASKDRGGNETVSDPIVYAILIFAVFSVGILLFLAIKAFKSPTLFYASEESIGELAIRLSCPKCRSRRLKPTGRYTIGCENCGFTFSVGTVRKRESR
jgi:hypothetical protein